MKKRPAIKPEQAMKQMQKIFKQRGTKALEMARKQILEERIESKQAREALNYFMTKYWHDVARPSLMELVCEAVGGKAELTSPIAISMSLISGAVDIHDDIIDQSRSKYGRATVYGKYGREIALLVGDALLFKGLTLINKVTDTGVPREKMGIIMDIIKGMFFELGDGEAMELQFRGNLDVSPEEYLKVVRKKAADVEAHTRISAILGGAPQELVEALGKYGRLLGMLILLRDDLMDIFDIGEAQSRIRKESLPLPLLYGLQHKKISGKLRRILLRKEVRRRDAELILKTIQKTEVLKSYVKLMNEMIEDANRLLAKQKLENENLANIIISTVAHLRETKS